jgi:hypothetical protein
LPTEGHQACVIERLTITGEYSPELVKRYPQLKGIVSVEAKQDLLAPAPVRKR